MPKLFKKLTGEIWEFAFWDKTEKIETLVISTHGIIKKADKVPKVEIERAREQRAGQV